MRKKPTHPLLRRKSDGVYDAPAALWKRRYEELKQWMDDARFEIDGLKMEEVPECAWDPPEFIYVSFANDVCQTEEHAMANFGEWNYDVYKLEERSPKE